MESRWRRINFRKLFHRTNEFWRSSRVENSTRVRIALTKVGREKNSKAFEVLLGWLNNYMKLSILMKHFFSLRFPKRDRLRLLLFVNVKTWGWRKLDLITRCLIKTCQLTSQIKEHSTERRVRARAPDDRITTLKGERISQNNTWSNKCHDVLDFNFIFRFDSQPSPAPFRRPPARRTFNIWNEAIVQTAIIIKWYEKK